ncbi:MAG: tetratricopeptide repeat protein [Solirubrobacteraceae bacterium]
MDSESLEGVVARCDVVLGSGADNARMRDDVAVAAFNKAVALRELGRYAEALTALEAAIAGYEKDPIAALPYLAVDARVDQIHCLRRLGRLGEGIEACDAVIARLGNEPVPHVRAKVIDAMWLKAGIANDYCGDASVRAQQVLAVLEELLLRIESEAEPDLADWTGALSWKASWLAWARRPNAVAVSDRLVALLARKADPAQLARAISNLADTGSTLVRAERPEEDLRVLEIVLARPGEATDPGAVAQALYQADKALGALERTDEAIGNFGALLTLFGESSEPGIAPWTMRALAVQCVAIAARRASQTGDRGLRRFGRPFRERGAPASARGARQSRQGRRRRPPQRGTPCRSGQGLRVNSRALGGHHRSGASPAERVSP